MSNIHYRPEIDGLRAVAVLGVVLFHIGLGLPGGYVGVDVFFVISGFLITGIIMKDLKRATFSILDFWVRRIRRILPAVGVMVTVSLIAGYYILSPNSFENLAKSSIAQSLIASNVFFWLDTGYFAESADYKPLLHTWSLAVEEQFYVVFPLVLLALWKWRKQYLVPALLLFGSISLVWCCIGVLYEPQATFFLLPSRAWEMVAGGLLAVWSATKEPSKRWSEVFAWSGLLMIFGSMIFYTSETLFPGWAAILPVGGSVLFIGANKGYLTSAGRLLALKPFVFIGLISYSLYLWHWPLLAFARNMIIDINLPWKLALFVGAMMLAVISWRFVETPFRKKTALATKLSAFSFWAISTVLLLSVSVLIWQNEGLPKRIDDQTAMLIEDIDWTGAEYKSQNEELVYLGLKTSREMGDNPIDFALWGDSHGMAAAAALDECALKLGMKGITFLSSSSPPVTGLWQYRWGHKRGAMEMAKTEAIFQKIIQKKVKNVLLVSRWSSMCDGCNEVQLRSKHCRLAREDTMAVDINNSRPSTGSSHNVLQTNLLDMVRMFNRHGVKVYLLKQIPETNDLHSAHHLYLSKKFPLINTMPTARATIDDHQRRQSSANDVINSLPRDLVNVYDASLLFFDSSGKLKTSDQRSYYRDDDHLTKYGADHYLSEMFKEILTDMKANK